MCHPDKPLYAKGMCRSCYEKNLRRRNPEYALRQRENAQQWAEKHKKRKRRVNKEYRAKMDPFLKWAHSLRKEHGITSDQYLAILAKQNGVCAICGKPKRTGCPSIMATKQAKSGDSCVSAAISASHGLQKTQRGYERQVSTYRP